MAKPLGDLFKMSKSKANWRLSGKKIAWPQTKAQAQLGWAFEERPGGWVIASRVDANGQVQRIRFSALESGKNLGALIGGQLWHGELQTKRRGGSGAGSGDSDLTAQFPGKVRKLLVANGEAVSEGQGLILVEAMKMEFSVKAPAAGTVRRVLVEEGQQVSPGQLFVEFLPSDATPDSN